MPDVDSAARKALADVIGPLVEEHGGAQAVATLVGVHKTRVYEWMKGHIPLERVGALASKLNTDITVHFPASGGVEIEEEAAPPDWAERLEAKVDQLVIGAIADPVQQRALRGLVSRLGVLPKPSAAGFGDLPDTEDQGTGTQAGQGAS